MPEMVVVARGLPSRASKKLGTGDDKCDPGAVLATLTGIIRNVYSKAFVKNSAE